MVFQPIHKEAPPGSRLPAETYEGRINCHNEGVMKIIKPSVQFYGTVPTEYNAALKFIEMAGRTCYKSEDKITEDSAEGFVKKLIKAGHLAMVEHSNFVVRIELTDKQYLSVIIAQVGKYLNIAGSDTAVLYVGGSITAWYNALQFVLSIPGVEKDVRMFEPFASAYINLFGGGYIAKNDWQVCPHDEIPKELHRYAAKFICDRGVSHELVRHRPCSFAQESTRYVNYGGKDMEFIEPDGFEGWNVDAKEIFEGSCDFASGAYNNLLHYGELKPQQARAVLPNALKTEIVVTTDAAEWAHIRKLRTAKSAHPDMQRVMNMMPWEEFL